MGTADEFEAKVKAIDDAAVETAAQVIGLAEERALFVRTGHRSAHTGEFRDGAGAMAALFPQHDNRNGEPNLHVHTVLLNRALRADQDASGDRKWRSLYGKALLDEQLGLGAAAERIFARRLTLLGIPLGKQEDSNAFEAGGLEQATMDAFAKRNQDKARTAAWPKKCVCGQPHTLVLTTRTGLPLSPRNVNRWFDARCKRYGSAGSPSTTRAAPADHS
jgi:hypothetical protein